MKKLLIITAAFMLNINMGTAQDKVKDRHDREMFGNTLNVGAGVGYYGYFGSPMPMGMVNYEFDVVRNFTLAPFVGMSGYQGNYYWRDPGYANDGYRFYTYSVMVVPIGVKGTYYFDQLFRAGQKWDFYAAASIGFAYSHVVWESDYYGNRGVYRTGNPLYMDAHIGAEYHLNHKLGLFLDLSTGVSTFGLAVHFNKI